MDLDEPNFELPGFRFKPTEEELLNFYLTNMIYEKQMHLDIIGFLDIYKYDPWDLPGLAKIGEREWYFFVTRDHSRKHRNGGKPNRITDHGFWKATGSDRKVICLSDPKRVIGLRKTLVFYKGRAPRGSKTDWVMNEYRLPNHTAPNKEIVLCKIYRKATSMKELEERTATEEAMILLEKSAIVESCPTSPLSLSNGEAFSTNVDFVPKYEHDAPTLKQEAIDEVVMFSNGDASNTTQFPPFWKDSLEGLEVPKLSIDWSHDPFSSQACSPWLDNLNSCDIYPNKFK